MKLRTNRVRLLAGILPFAVVVLVSAFHANTSVAQRTSHLVYYVHGRIYTNDPAQPWAEAIAVSEGKIA